jgi:hypothetical protein
MVAAARTQFAEGWLRLDRCAQPADHAVRS